MSCLTIATQPDSKRSESSDSEDEENTQSENDQKTHRVIPNSMVLRSLQGGSEDEFSSSNGEESQEIAREFHLGRFCARRARTFHNFMHWEVRSLIP
jgi:hypothetical protein